MDDSFLVRGLERVGNPARDGEGFVDRQRLIRDGLKPVPYS